MDLKKIVFIIGAELYKWTDKYPMLSEIRLHSDNYVTLNDGIINIITDVYINSEKFKRIISEFCGHSLHTYENTIKKGYIELGDGYRAGVCGNAVTEKDKYGKDQITALKITAVSIRIPHMIEGVADELYEIISAEGRIKSSLIYSPPAMGKTTMLRDLAIKLANEKKLRIALIDSRCELKTDSIEKCPLIDIYSGYPKADAIEAATRTMSPQVIICDEIGGYDEAEAILSAQNTGVPFIATAHAASAEMLLRRKNIGILHENMIFEFYVGLAMKRERLGFVLNIKKYEDIGSY